MNEHELLSSGLHRLLRIGVWAMPVHGALLTISTLTHQPDYEADFAAGIRARRAQSRHCRAHDPFGGRHGRLPQGLEQESSARRRLR